MNTKFLSNIPNKQAYESLVEIIQNWTNTKTWIYGIENPFLERSAYSYPSPFVSGEAYFVFETKSVPPLLMVNWMNMFILKLSKQRLYPIRISIQMEISRDCELFSNRSKRQQDANVNSK